MLWCLSTRVVDLDLPIFGHCIFGVSFPCVTILPVIRFTDYVTDRIDQACRLGVGRFSFAFSPKNSSTLKDCDVFLLKIVHGFCTRIWMDFDSISCGSEKQDSVNFV